GCAALISWYWRIIGVTLPASLEAMGVTLAAWPEAMGVAAPFASEAGADSGTMLRSGRVMLCYRLPGSSRYHGGLHAPRGADSQGVLLGRLHRPPARRERGRNRKAPDERPEGPVQGRGLYRRADLHRERQRRVQEQGLRGAREGRTRAAPRGLRGKAGRRRGA